MAEFEDRIAKLERTIAHLRGGAVVTVVVLAGYFGATSLWQLPGLVRQQLPAAVTEYVNEKHPGFDDELRKELEGIKSLRQEAHRLLDNIRRVDKQTEMEAKKKGTLDEMETKMEELLSDHEAKNENVRTQLEVLDNNKLSDIEFWYDCNEYTGWQHCGDKSKRKPPACPGDFSEVHTQYHDWGEGDCGHAVLCSVCVQKIRSKE